MIYDFEITCECRSGDAYCEWIIQATHVRTALSRLRELDPQAVPVRMVRKEIVRLASNG